MSERLVTVAELERRYQEVTGLHDRVAASMPALSHLECSVCGHRQDVGDAAGHLRNGWPTCCKGYAMTLYTQRQVEEMNR